MKKKSTPGRKKIAYPAEELERQPMVLLVCGETGVGKTYRNKNEIAYYLKDNPSTGKKGRKVLAFDTNDDDYPEFRSVKPRYLKAITDIRARRIRPFKEDRSPMDNEEKRGVVESILKHYENGLIVLDDIDHYMTGSKGQSMIGALCTVRHKGMDLLLTHQSIAKISTTEWQNCTWLRLHHQVDDVTRYRQRIPKYHLVRMAQLIIDEQYELAAKAYASGRIDRDEYKKRKSFFLYVDMREQKIKGCTAKAFVRAAKKYLQTEERKKIGLMLAETDPKGKAIYANEFEALTKLVSDYLRFWDEGDLQIWKEAE